MIAKQRAVEQQAAPKRDGAIRPVNPNTARPPPWAAESHDELLAQKGKGKGTEAKAPSVPSNVTSESAPQQSYTGQWNSNWQWTTAEWNTWHQDREVLDRWNSR